MCLIREFKIPVDWCYLWSANKDVYLNSHKIGRFLAKSLYESNTGTTETLTCKIFKTMILQLFSTCKSLHEKRSINAQVAIHADFLLKPMIWIILFIQYGILPCIKW